MSKRSNILIAGGIILVGLFIGGFLVLGSKSGLADFSKQLASLVYKNPQSQDPKLIDSDNDGLPDYLEEIYHTDPHNPDTDSDGYLDGEEVMSGYDPLKSAPNDKISDNAIVPRPKPGSFIGVNLTEELAKSIAENMKNSTPDASSINLGSASADDIAAGLEPQAGTIVDNALSTALAKSPNLNFIPIFQDSDIKISNDTGKDAGQAYVSQVKEVLSKNANFPKSCLETAQEAIQIKNYALLDPYIIGYKNSYLALKEISVPQDWKEIHKQNLSLLLASANILETIKIIDIDPLRATLAIQEYQQTVLPGFQNMYSKIIDLIKQLHQQ